MTISLNKKYKNLKKYYNYLNVLNSSIKTTDFLLCNFIYYSNVNYIWYQNLMSKYKFNIKFVNSIYKICNTVILPQNISVLFDKVNIDILKFNPYFDIIYIRLLTHKQLISFTYLCDLLKKYGYDKLNIHIKILILINYNKIKILKLLNKKTIN